jgi:hypothetical protein
MRRLSEVNRRFWFLALIVCRRFIASKGNTTMDCIAYDPETGYVWVPAINIGSVDVVNTNDGSVREISGFATKEVEFDWRKRVQGPGGVSVGDGVVYIGEPRA